MKTKLGLSGELLAGIFFLMLLLVTFSGSALFMYGLIALAAYVLYKEDDRFLKASIVKGALISLFFGLIYICLGFADDMLDFINFFLGLAKIAPVRDGFGIVAWIALIIHIIEKILLIVLALFAFKRKTIKLPIIDSLISKHM